MRENRTYGSEGGGTGTTGPSYPYPAFFPRASSGRAGAPLSRRAGGGLGEGKGVRVPA